MTDQGPSTGGDDLTMLRQKVAAAQQERLPKEAPGMSGQSGMALGLRMAADFVAAIAVGVVFGFGADLAFGSTPWGLIVGLGFGFAAGVVSLVRSAKRMSAGVPIGRDLPPSDDDAAR